MTRRLGSGRLGAAGDAGEATNLSPIVTIASRSDLATVSTTPGPQYTINVHALVTAPGIPLLAGESIVTTETGAITALSQEGGFVGDFDGAMINGPLLATGLACVNLSTHADAYVYGIESTAGRIAKIQNCVAVGPAGAVLVTDANAAITIIDLSTVGTASGVVITGAITDFATQLQKSLGLAPGFVGVDIKATAVLSGIVSLDVLIVLVSATTYGIAISDAVTVSPGALIQVMSGKVSGPQGNLFRQAPGDMAISDDRLLVSGSSSGNWVALMDAERTDLADPLIVVFPVTPTAVPVPIPYWTGSGLKITVVSLAHWVMVLDDPNVGDMYFEYTGEKANSSQSMSMQILIDRNAGTNPITLGFDRDTNPPTDVWSIIPTTYKTIVNTNSFQTSVTTGGDATFNKGDRVRPASQNEVDGVDARIYEIAISLRGV